jgi:hypothetical protein
MRFILYLVLSSFFSSLGQAQTLTPIERSNLTGIVYDFFFDSPIAKNNTNRNSGISEKFILLLNTNDSGKVKQVLLLSDANHRDSGYAILSKLGVDDFKKWQARSAKGVTIMLPLVVINSGTDFNEMMDYLIGLSKLGSSPGVINLPGIDFRRPRRGEY